MLPERGLLTVGVLWAAWLACCLPRVRPQPASPDAGGIPKTGPGADAGWDAGPPPLCSTPYNCFGVTCPASTLCQQPINYVAWQGPAGPNYGALAACVPIPAGCDLQDPCTCSPYSQNLMQATPSDAGSACLRCSAAATDDHKCIVVMCYQTP